MKFLYKKLIYFKKRNYTKSYLFTTSYLKIYYCKLSQQNPTDTTDTTDSDRIETVK